jgi:dTDP-4-dehydrorhamnose 3,5-epimerase-like enzyme
MSLASWIDFKVLGDERGQLVSLEQHKNIPFNVRRVYYLFDTKLDVSRGFHAHKELQQVAVCLAGKCRMRLDNGFDKKDIWLDSPKKGLFIDEMIWREMHNFSEDCILLVLASNHYDEDDYIRDYQEFIEYMKNG